MTDASTSQYCTSWLKGRQTSKFGARNRSVGTNQLWRSTPPFSGALLHIYSLLFCRCEVVSSIQHSTTHMMISVIILLVHCFSSRRTNVTFHFIIANETLKECLCVRACMHLHASTRTISVSVITRFVWICFSIFKSYGNKDHQHVYRFMQILSWITPFARFFKLDRHKLYLFHFSQLLSWLGIIRRAEAVAAAQKAQRNFVQFICSLIVSLFSPWYYLLRCTFRSLCMCVHVFEYVGIYFDILVACINEAMIFLTFSLNFWAVLLFALECEPLKLFSWVYKIRKFIAH